MCIYSRHVSYTLCREEGLASSPARLISSVREKEPGYEAKEGSGHTATMELSLRQKLDVANQFRTCRRSHPLSWSTITRHSANCSTALPKVFTQQRFTVYQCIRIHKLT